MENLTYQQACERTQKTAFLDLPDKTVFTREDVLRVISKLNAQAFRAGAEWAGHDVSEVPASGKPEIRVTLPYLLGTRDSVRELLRMSEVPDQYSPSRIILLCRASRLMAESACDEFIQQVIARRVEEVILVGAGRSLMEVMFAAAEKHGYKNIWNKQA